MKRPVCRLCRTPHYSHEPHKFEDEAPSKPEVGIAPHRRSVRSADIQEGPVSSSDPAGQGVVSPDAQVVREVVVVEASEVPSKADRALTRAEISRRQRERDPEGYKKANRARMQRNRRKG